MSTKFCSNLVKKKLKKYMEGNTSIIFSNIVLVKKSKKIKKKYL